MRGSEVDLPPGFRFHPTDDELVNHYLCRKCVGQPIAVPIIAEIDLYKYDPWLLPGMALYGEKEWYFFSPRDRKYPNGSRPNRAAGTGYWKATGADKPIGRPNALGIKKALVFYAGKAPRGIKTDWIMHEYRLAHVDRSPGKTKKLRLDDWVLCRIYNKKGSMERYGVDRKLTKHQEMEMEMEDRKPNVLMPGQNGMAPPQQPPLAPASMTGHGLLQMDASDSMPMFHTDSSCSEHVLSPEVTCEREVQSEPKWIDEPHGSFDFNLSRTDAFQDDPFASQVQYQMEQLSPLQDMFTYLQRSL